MNELIKQIHNQINFPIEWVKDEKTIPFFFAVRCLRATKVAGGALQSAKWVKRRTS